MNGLNIDIMNYFRKIGFVIIIAWLFVPCLQAQLSDNDDGTFTNPVLWSDVPDPDVIRAGEIGRAHV